MVRRLPQASVRLFGRYVWPPLFMAKSLLEQQEDAGRKPIRSSKPSFLPTNVFKGQPAENTSDGGYLRWVDIPLESIFATRVDHHSRLRGGLVQSVVVTS